MNIYDPNKWKFEHYYHIPHDKSSLSGNHIWSIIEDSSGKIWVATNLNGVNWLDPITGKNKIFKHDPNDPNSLPSNTTSHIIEDKSGIIWIGTRSGLSRYDPATDKFTNYQANYSEPENQDYLSHSRITALLEDRDSYLWIGTLR